MLPQRQNHRLHRRHLHRCQLEHNTLSSQPHVRHHHQPVAFQHRAFLLYLFLTIYMLLCQSHSAACLNPILSFNVHFIWIAARKLACSRRQFHGHLHRLHQPACNTNQRHSHKVLHLLLLPRPYHPPVVPHRMYQVVTTPKRITRS